MKQKQVEQAIEEYRDKYAKELFGKPCAVLDVGENWRLDEYIKDIRNPIWKIAETRKGDKVEVSNVGQVRDPKTKEMYKIYDPDKSRSSAEYPTVWIDYPNMPRGKYPQTVHRLVANAFCPNDDPEHKTDVNHINGNKQCNWAGNLEWCDRSYNIREAIRLGLNRPLRGEESARATCTEKQVRQACELLKAHPDWPYSKISDLTGVSTRSLRGINRGKIWLHVVKDYLPIPSREVDLDGENNGYAKYTEAQIRQVCQLLQDRPDLTCAKVGELTAVNANVVRSVYERIRWKEVSKDYKFPPRLTRARGTNLNNSKYTEDQIRHACRMLDEVYSGNISTTHKEIANECGVSLDTVKDLARGRIWKSILSDYQFYKAKFD